MNFELSLTITGIIALCSIVSPIVVSVVNNIFLLKVKRLELNEKYIVLAFQNYLTNLVHCIGVNRMENYQDYNAALGQALLFASDKSKDLMIEIDEKIKAYPEKDDLSDIITSDMIAKIFLSLRNDTRTKKV